jgi:proteasome lid subunit RPN8/RPN11
MSTGRIAGASTLAYRPGNRNFLVLKMVFVPQPVLDQIHRQGERAYPHEACGILLGSVSEIGISIAQAVEMANVSPRPASHYEIDPVELICTERSARIAGLEIVGFSHSHPDHPAQWSATDLAEAHWLGCVYIITSVQKGKAGETSAFLLAGTVEEDKRFQSERLVFLPTPE